MTINFKTPEIKELKPRILVLGVGGAGGNAINKMIDCGLQGVEFVAVNTDAQDLIHSKAKAKIQIGLNLTKGLGAGSKIDIGQAAADESLNEIVNCLQGANMVFITAGMGGGTGTGSAHVIARAAKELNILTVGVVTLPFSYEGPSRMRRAQQGLEELRKHVDTIIVVPNQNLFKIANEQTTFDADVETVMSSMGKAMMGTGEAEGENRATKAAEQAINNPLIDDYSLKGAKGLLINITGGKDLTLFEVDEAVNKIRSEVDPDAEFIKGCITDHTLEGKIRISIVATSLDGQHPEQKSVINMVHRIQNRNPGYSDLPKVQSGISLNPKQSEILTNTRGANALKIDSENVKDSETELLNSMVDENMAIDLNNDISSVTSAASNEDSISENTMILDNPAEDNINDNQENYNGLENFELRDETPKKV